MTYEVVLQPERTAVNIRTIIGGFSILVLALAFAPAPEQEEPGESMLARIDQIVDEAMAGSGATRVVVAIDLAGEPFLQRSYGASGAGDADTDELFRVGAMCQPFVAAALLRLAQDERIDLDAELGEYLPDLTYEGSSPRVRQLLAHTSGLPSYETFLELWGRRAALEESEQEARASEASSNDMVDEIVGVLSKLGLDTEPGSCFAYTHTNDLIATALLVRVTGQSLSECLGELVFEPCGMDSTEFCGELAATSVADDEREIAGGSVALPEHTDLFGEPGLCSNAPDLMSWVRTLLDRELLDESHWRLFSEAVILEDGEAIPFGHGMGSACWTSAACSSLGGLWLGSACTWRTTPSSN